MIEIYSALIFHLFTLIVIALAAQKSQRSLHEFSFKRAFKLIRSFLLTQFQRFLQPSLTAVDEIFPILVEMIVRMSLSQKPHDDFTFQSQFT